MINAAITIAISFVVTFIATMVIGFDDPEPKPEEAKGAPVE